MIPTTLELKDEFNDMKNLRESIIFLLDNLNTKVATLKNIYRDLLSNNTSHAFGLDSLHFQAKIINLECNHKDLIFKTIDNRIYGDYYKLYQLIINYVNKNISDKKILQLCDNCKHYNVYKDLDNTKIYNFTETIEIHKDIMQIIDALQNELSSREHELQMEDNKRKSGLNIDNLINSHTYNNNLLRQHVILYINYIKVFHKFHIKYLHRFNIKTKIFYGQINSDIKLEKTNDIMDNDSVKHSSLTIDKVEQNTLKSYIDHEIKSLSNFKTTTKNIMDNEVNSMLNGSDESGESIYDSANKILGLDTLNLDN
jgi:hypothetical protein